MSGFDLLEDAFMAHEARDLDKALFLYQQAIEADPQLLAAYNNAAYLLAQTGQVNAALALLQRALLIDGKAAFLYRTLGFLLGFLGDRENQIKAYQRAIFIDPLYEAAIEDLEVLLDQGDFDEAERVFAKILELNPVSAIAHRGYAHILYRKGYFDKAEYHYKQALSYRANDPGSHFGLSLIQLTAGNFIDGWVNYEYRLCLPQISIDHFPQPLWQGEAIYDKTLLVHAEQSMIEIVQFMRYLSLLKGRVKTCILRIQDPLRPLFEDIEGVDLIITHTEPLPEFDLHIPLLSLPNRFNTNIQTIPRLQPQVKQQAACLKKWQQHFDAILGATGGVRVGLVWSCREAPSVSLSSNALKLQDLKALGWIRGVQFISLQLDEDIRAIEQNTWLDVDLVNPGLGGETLVDLVAMIECLDIVIGVDSLALHLAALMEKKTWLLCEYRASWRWLQERDDSPFYPKMKIYRQRSEGDWGEVINRVASDLLRL